MRFSSDAPDEAAIKAQAEAKRPMMNCSHCGEPVCRLGAAGSDYFWRRHYDECEPYLEAALDHLDYRPNEPTQ